MFEKKIALFKQHAATKEEALKMLADKFVEADVVRTDFLQGILKRESVFPTGLDTDTYGVAIPHTDPEYVKENQLGFLSLDEPVVFQNMADPEQEVKVSVIFMMAIQGHDQVEMLMKLMGIFTDQQLLEDLTKVENYEKFEEVMKSTGLI